MIDQSTQALFEALEQRAERSVQGEHALRDAQATIADLERRLNELEVDHQRLRDELESREAPVAPRSQGLAALMARRPRAAKQPPADVAPSSTSTVAEAEASPSPPITTVTPTAPESKQPTAEQVTEKSGDTPVVQRQSLPVTPAAPTDSQPQASDERQSKLPIGEAPSPQALLDEWYQRYPKTFFKGHTRPLKVGIHEDLVGHEPWPEKLVRRALACYVHLPRYLKAVRSGAERVDLDGESAGTVSDGEARYARRQLDELRAQSRTRRAQQAERQAQRDKEARLEDKLSQLLAKHEQR